MLYNNNSSRLQWLFTTSQYLFNPINALWFSRFHKHHALLVNFTESDFMSTIRDFSPSKRNKVSKVLMEKFRLKKKSFVIVAVMSLVPYSRNSGTRSPPKVAVKHFSSSFLLSPFFNFWKPNNYFSAVTCCNFWWAPPPQLKAPRFDSRRTEYLFKTVCPLYILINLTF